MKFLILFVATIWLVHSKFVLQSYPVRRLINENNFMYLAKIDFGIGRSTAKVILKMIGKPSKQLQSFNIGLGLLLDENFPKVQQLSTCLQKRRLLTDYRIAYKINDGQEHTSEFIIEQTVREHLWNFYLFSCDEIFEGDKQNYGLWFQVEIEMLNNGSHFGEDEKVTWVYLVALIVAAILAPTNIVKLYRGWMDGERDWAHFIVCGGILGLIIAYFYKLVHLLVYSLNGEGVPSLDVLFLISKTMSECAIINLLLVISWGWTITYINGENQELYLPIGLMATIIHIITTALGKITDGGEHKNHHFDCATGYIILTIRLMTVAAFVAGVCHTHSKVRPKAKRFVTEFGMLGFMYLAGHPLAVIFCELALPAYLQHKTITAFVEITHALANGLLTYMITSKRSSYTSLDYSHRTVFTPMNDKVF